MKRQDKKQSAVSSILAIDIGNTTVAVGLFSHGGRLLFQAKFATYSYQNSSEWLHVFQRWFRNKKISLGCIETIVICSVVPKVTPLIRDAIYHLPSTIHHPNLLVVGRDIKVPIPNLYHNPKQVGQDRLVNAYAGYVQYGSPLILVDFGTAVTFDIVSKKGEYLGGIILPGLEIARDGLAERTALLPRVRLVPPTRLIGKTTRQSIQSGLFYGLAALTEGVAARIRRQIGRAQVIATGGQAKEVAMLTPSVKKVDPYLTLRGLYLLIKESS